MSLSSVKPRRPSALRQRGFTLVELLIGLAVFLLIILGALQLLDTTNRVAAIEANRTDMQQTLRAAQSDMIRKVRGLGRGGLPASDPTRPLPQGVSVAVLNNVALGTKIAGAGSPTVVAGTDVLIVRAVYDSLLYQVRAADPTSFTIDVTPSPAERLGNVVVEDATPLATLPQSFKKLHEIIDAGTADALVLVSAATDDIYGVVELDPAGSSFVTDGTLERGTIAFKASSTSSNADTFAKLSPSQVFPYDALSKSEVITFGILEEYRYYVREEFQVPGDNTTPLAPRLSRARVFPNTDIPYDNDAANFVVDIADNIFDLQVALGFDSDFDGARDGNVVASVDGSSDDWALNDPDRDEGADSWAASTLFYLRVTTLARSAVRERGYQAPLLDHVEDHDYTASTFNNYAERLYRRIQLETVVDMRNLG